MPNRYIYAGLYEDRDGDLKDIFFTFRQRKDGEWFIHFRGENGAAFQYWNTGRSKIDMITWDATVQALWAHKLAPDGSWIPGKKMAGVALRHRELKRLFDDPLYRDPYQTNGRTVTQMGPRVNTAHTEANAIPGGASGNVWADPGDWVDDDDDESDSPDISEDEDARRSNIRKGKRKARESADADESPAPAHPFAGFFSRIAGRSLSLSPSPPPDPSKLIDLIRTEEEQSLDRGRSRSQENNGEIIIENTRNETNTPDIPLPSIEDNENDAIKIELRRSTPYRMRLEGDSLRARSQSPTRINSHTPDSVQVPSSWPGRSRYRGQSSPISPTTVSSALKSLREKRGAKAAEAKTDIVTDSSASSSKSKKPLRSIITVDINEIITINDD